MSRFWGMFFVLIVVLIATPAADAQKRGETALTIGHPSAVGLMWHVAQRVALRSDVAFSKSKTEVPNGTIDDVWSAAFGLSALFYFPPVDSLRMYLAPRLTYGRTDGEPRPRSETYGLSARIGLQYPLSRKLSVYGEAGVQYSRTTTPMSSQFGPADLKRYAWDTPSGVGIAFHF
jgi:hypothetical protein